MGNVKKFIGNLIGNMKGKYLIFQFCPCSWFPPPPKLKGENFFQDPKLRAENPKYEKARGYLFSRGDLVCQGGTFVIPFNLRFRFMNPTVMQIFSDLYQVCIAHLFQVFMI